MLRKITLPLFAAGFVFIGVFGASDDATDAHSVQVTPTGVPSVSPTMTATATITPIPFGSASPMQTATPPAEPEYPIKPHPAPTTTP